MIVEYSGISYTDDFMAAKKLIDEEKETLYLHPDTKVILNAAFSNSALKQVYCTPKLAKIEERAFYGCKLLYEVILNRNLKYIGDHAFSECGMEKIIIPENVEYLGESAFSNCKHLKEIKLPKNLTEIQANCFDNCISLPSLEIPKNVKVIKECAFAGCKNLKYLDLRNVEVLENRVFAESGITVIDISNEMVNFDLKALENCAIKRINFYGTGKELFESEHLKELLDMCKGMIHIKLPTLEELVDSGMSYKEANDYLRNNP